MLILSVIILSIGLYVIGEEALNGTFETEEAWAMVILIGIPWSYLIGELIQKLI